MQKSTTSTKKKQGTTASVQSKYTVTSTFDDTGENNDMLSLNDTIFRPKTQREAERADFLISRGRIHSMKMLYLYSIAMNLVLTGLLILAIIVRF